MANPKAQTLQQRFGFQDNELLTPKHDEMMLWLDTWVDTGLSSLVQRQHAEIFVEKKVGYDIYDSQKMHVEEFDLRFGSHEELIPKININLRKKIWEYPITNKSYTIGFADMLCLTEGSWGQPTYSMETEKLSFTYYHDARFYFEVKPTIPSLGEVLRQVRMYETYTLFPSSYFGGWAKWFIVSPDVRFKPQLEAQGIGFIEAR